MEPRSLKYVAEACGGELLQGSPETRIARVCTDSRQAQPGDLFVALAGERFDGHAFVGDVTARQVAAVMVDPHRLSVPVAGTAVIGVSDTRQALGRLAARYRQDFDLPIIAVAGSNGKTTTKELLASVLREELRVVWSEASFNNDIGVPLTLLKLDQTHQAAILEAGTNHPGELAPLVRMMKPRLGVITSIGHEHLEFFGDLAGVVREEGSLAELLPADGKLLVNSDTPEIDRVVARTRAKVEHVGMGDRCSWRAEAVRVNANGTTFQVRSPRGDLDGEYRVQLLGRHQAVNALLALAVGAELGLKPEALRRGLAGCQPAKMRMQSWEINGVRVLDDAYNANADSVQAALQTLRDLPCAGRRIAVLGHMAELGSHGSAAHRQVGRRAAEVGVDHLFAVGEMAADMASAARAAGLRDVTEISTVEAAAQAVKIFVKPDDVVLLKASRSTRLERVGEALRSGG